jgi:hypothetical protein
LAWRLNLSSKSESSWLSAVLQNMCPCVMTLNCSFATSNMRGL